MEERKNERTKENRKRENVNEITNLKDQKPNRKGKKERTNKKKRMRIECQP